MSIISLLLDKRKCHVLFSKGLAVKCDKLIVSEDKTWTQLNGNAMLIVNTVLSSYLFEHIVPVFSVNVVFKGELNLMLVESSQGAVTQSKVS